MIRTALVNEGLGEMRARPTHSAEQVSQAILGTLLAVVSTRDAGRWLRVETPDGYAGWMRSWSVHPVSRSEAAAYAQGPRVEVDSMVARVRERPTARSPVIREAPLGARLGRVSRSGNWIRVLLPDGGKGYLHARDLLVDKRTLRPRRRPRDIPSLIRTCHRFLGVPYQWGGITAKGIDCSGLVQTVFGLHGVTLPRDSGDQYRWVGERAYVSDDPSGVQFGHLLFFGTAAARISHVAVGLGGGGYLHARGRVRINSLRPDEPGFDRDLFRLFRGSGPVLLR